MSSLRSYLDDANKPKTQQEQADPRQVKNNAGGYTFQVSDKTRLERFLILGVDGGTYYVDEQDLTKQNVDWLIDLIKRDENGLVIDRAADISHQGRAMRNDTAIFVLELIFQHGTEEQKQAVRRRFQSIARNSYHLYQSCDFAERMGGAWGESRQKAVCQWYLDKTPEQLAYQAVKYRSRKIGDQVWTHRDVLRLAHPTGIDPRVGDFILGKEHAYQSGIIEGFQAAQIETSVRGMVNILDTFPSLPWEALPTQFHKEPDVWKKLFYNGQLSGQALVRNITRLSRIGAFSDMVFAADYATKLTDEEMIRKTRLHPFNYLNALIVHEHGQIYRPKKPFERIPEGVRNIDGVARLKTWTTVPVILDALNAGFYLSFAHAESSGKRMFLGLDVSGSMANPASGLDMSCAQAGAVMAMAIAKTEHYYQVWGFSDGTRDVSRFYGSYNKRVLTDLGISPGMSLTDVMQKTRNHNFGRTDCALPMEVALRDKIEVDTFGVITDNETWYGGVHPHVALEQYRQGMGRDAKLVVVGMTATPFTIANPTDAGMLDVVGFDSSVPKLITEFSKRGF